MINQPPANDNQGNAEDGDDSPTYLDLYKGEANEQTENAEENQQRSAQKANPLKDGPKWTDKAIVLLTAGIVFLAFMQWKEMNNAGAQTDKIIAADERLAQAMEDSVTQAKRGLDASIEVSRNDQRAWVGVVDVVGTPVAGKPFLIAVNFRNTGRTPAKKFIMRSVHQEFFSPIRLPILFCQPARMVEISMKGLYVPFKLRMFLFTSTEKGHMKIFSCVPTGSPFAIPLIPTFKDIGPVLNTTRLTIQSRIAALSRMAAYHNPV